MLRLLVVACCASLLSACGPRLFVKNRPAKGQRPRVAVLPFADYPGQAGTGELAREAFSTEILAVEAYQVIDRASFQKLLDEHRLSATGAIDPSKAVEVGKLLGADAVVVGAVTEYKKRNLLMFPPARVGISARMIDAKTGVVDWSAQKSVGGPKRWLTWVIWPVGAVATAFSPSAADQVVRATRSICRGLRHELAAAPQ
ncbi:MAG: DUF799 family lipoprotein [Elusimicrobia bacterium]|nr:DUF799 family lipoprotein [Elusimicrobiota bacterium]